MAKLGQKEDPEFTFKAMLVRVQVAGASTDDMQLQVTDRVEKLMEHPDLDFVKATPNRARRC